MLTSNLTLYVSATGDRGNDGLSWDTALDTVARALNKIPRNLNGYTAIINVGAGTFPGFNVPSFYGGKEESYGGIQIIGTIENGTRITTINGYIYCRGAHANVYIHFLNATGVACYGGNVYMSGLRLSNGAYGVCAQCGARVYATEVWVSNASQAAFMSWSGSILVVSGYAQYSGNLVGLQSGPANGTGPGIILAASQVPGTTNNVKNNGQISVGGAWV